MISFIFGLKNLYLNSLKPSLISLIFFLERLIFVFGTLNIFIKSSLDLFSSFLRFATIHSVINLASLYYNANNCFNFCLYDMVAS